MPVTEGREEVVDGEIQIVPAARSEHRDYESIAVEEAWLISLEAGTVEIQLLEDGKLRQSRILTEGTLKPKHFPGVQIDISGIWPD